MFRTTTLAIAMAALFAPAANAMSLPILLPSPDFPSPDASPVITQPATKDQVAK